MLIHVLKKKISQPLPENMGIGKTREILQKRMLTSQQLQVVGNSIRNPNLEELFQATEESCQSYNMKESSISEVSEELQ